MAIPSSHSLRSESEMATKRPVMPLDLFRAAINGNTDVLIRRLRLVPELKEMQVIGPMPPYRSLTPGTTQPMMVRNIMPEILRSSSFSPAFPSLQVTIEASHFPPQQIKPEHQTVQSELQCATRFGDTVLHLLVTKRHNELALMVFRRDVSLLKSPNKNLETPLHCAAKFGHEMVIHNLIQIDPVAVKDALQQTNESGDTALHVAANYGNIDISIALMKLDPEVAYRVNNNMFSALNVAIDRKYTKLVLAMLEQDHALAYTQFSTGMFPVHLAASMGNKKLVFHLMEKYPECAELLDPRGRNLFHYAVEENKYNIFRETSEDTSIKEIMTRMNIAKDCEGNTPLHIASMKGNWYIMIAICGNKMNNVAKTIQNKQGLTPFELSWRQQLGTYKNFKNGWERTQVVGLGSVLITTVAFAAAFTIPGGYNQDHGTPVLGKRYIFRAFILADALAFIQGSISLLVLLVTALSTEFNIAIPFATLSFFLAASSMIVAFGLGLYVTLASVCYPIAVLILVITLFLGSHGGLFFIAFTHIPLIARPDNAALVGVTMASITVSFLIIFCLAFL